MLLLNMTVPHTSSSTVTPVPGFTGIQSIFVFVDDLARAVEFYVGRLGLELRREEEPLPGLRIAEVSIPQAATSIMLVRPSLEAMGAGEASRAHNRVGEPTGMLLEVDSLDKAAEELERRGVELAAGESWESLGTRALRFRDPAENEFVLVESGTRP
jgi:catechol 2,3-dioxygenase-like lactoylglutathione lyase family enzyme